MEPLTRVVVWGYEPHSHTHAYIHAAFRRAFEHLGYTTAWLRNEPQSADLSWSGCLFVTEGNVDSHIPLDPGCYYVLHNCDRARYSAVVPPERLLNIQVFTYDVVQRATPAVPDTPYHHFDGETLYMPWATDLLPDEVEENARLVMDERKDPLKKIKGEVAFVGMMTEEWERVRAFVKARGLAFGSCGGFSGTNVSTEENARRIRAARLAPAIVTRWQQAKGYIPCRIFKNISYGAVGVTNSGAAADLFEGRLVYHPHIETALDRAIRAPQPLQEQLALMRLVAEKHTYINRIETILWALDRLSQRGGASEAR